MKRLVFFFGAAITVIGAADRSIFAIALGLICLAATTHGFRKNPF